MNAFSSAVSSSLAKAGVATAKAEPITAMAADRRVIKAALGAEEVVVLGARALDEPIEMAAVMTTHANDENVAVFMVLIVCCYR